MTILLAVYLSGLVLTFLLLTEPAHSVGDCALHFIAGIFWPILAALIITLIIALHILGATREKQCDRKTSTT